MKIRVYYEDTDKAGVVYHTNYIAFCERARSEKFFQNGITFENEGFIVRHIDASFYAPAKLGDLLEVKTQIDSIKRSFVNVTQQIYKDDTLLFEAKTKLVFLKDWKISTIPENYMKIFDEFQK